MKIYSVVMISKTWAKWEKRAIKKTCGSIQCPAFVKVKANCHFSKTYASFVSLRLVTNLNNRSEMFPRVLQIWNTWVCAGLQSHVHLPYPWRMIKVEMLYNTLLMSDTDYLYYWRPAQTIIRLNRSGSCCEILARKTVFSNCAIYMCNLVSGHVQFSHTIKLITQTSLECASLQADLPIHRSYKP